MTNYISDFVCREDFDPNAFNLIDAGPGAGKTTFINEKLHELFPEVPYENILMAESRSLTVSMLEKGTGSNFSRLGLEDGEKIKQLSGLPEINPGTINPTIATGTYDKLVDMVAHNNSRGDILSGVDIVVLDEAHCLYCDNFISNMKAVSVWLKGLFSPERSRRPLVIGMTATPEVFLELNQFEQNFPIHRVLDKKLVKHRAEHLICGTMNDIPSVCKNRFKGRTIIMCEKVEDCYMLARLLKNAAVVCSASNEKTNEEMIRIRRYIEEKAALPETYLNLETNRWEPLKYLIMTSTGREGYNFLPLDKRGGLQGLDIQNVIVCFTDPMSIIQFAGRPRYDIPNLMVAMNPSAPRGSPSFDSFKRYQYEQREAFKAFAIRKDRRGDPWFKLMSPFLKETVDEIEILDSLKQSKKVMQNIQKKMRSDSLVSVFVKIIEPYISTGNDENRLYVDGDAIGVVAAAERVGLLSSGEYTMSRIKNVLQRNGFSVESKDDQSWTPNGNIHHPYYVIRRTANEERNQEAT